ncbi:hypothetical protein [Streptomyces sp. S.PNR 29]|uniref:hypothetical protein n=1 Tax=Streptomyces sp. S.PNR 29 TaxID=2973805 RepID=UPI0025B1A539|nr:hypothetical protein [Streptomyces sp. S.PNR 29]MDN0200463.1 hypothetical protein [Streptomyces sp. S.PNR 29]
MHHPPAARVLVASAFATAALLTATACSVAFPDAAPSAPGSTRSRATAPSSAEPRALTEEQVRAALISEADLGEPWMPTQGAATWRDRLLKADTDDPDCHRLLDVLYTEEVFGAATGPHAVVGLDDGYHETQLRYRVAAHRPADADRTLAWLRALPGRCERFTAVTRSGDEQRVHVTGLPLPNAGDARQGLRVTLSGETADGEPTFLTVEVAAVRVGEHTISLTNGGQGDVPADATWKAVELGTQRLTEIRKQGRVEI